MGDRYGYLKENTLLNIFKLFSFLGNFMQKQISLQPFLKIFVIFSYFGKNVNFMKKNLHNCKSKFSGSVFKSKLLTQLFILLAEQKADSKSTPC